MRTLLVLLAITAVRLAGAADVRVSVEVVDSGSNMGNPAYDLRTTVSNVTSRALELAIMKCSWEEIFRVDPTDALSTVKWDCDGNYPVTIKLQPRSDALFRFQITTKAGRPPPKRFRIGFVADLAERGVMSRDGKPFWPGEDPKAPAIWSDWESLPPVSEKRLNESHEPAEASGAVRNVRDESRK